VNAAPNVAEVQKQANGRREIAELRRQRAEIQSVSCLRPGEGDIPADWFQQIQDNNPTNTATSTNTNTSAHDPTNDPAGTG
jgi:hypothetical protein